MIINVEQQNSQVVKKDLSAAMEILNDSNNNELECGEMQEFCKLIDEINDADEKGMNLTNFLTFNNLKDTLYHQSRHTATKCSKAACFNGAVTLPSSTSVKSPELVVLEAKRFLDQYFTYNDKNFDNYEKRLLEIIKSIQKSGTYQLTTEELEFGIRQAYRNSSFITDRWEWDNLKVLDHRNVKTSEEMFEAICGQLRYMTNGGVIRNAVSVFPSAATEGSFRIWNSQLISYAGYQQDDGSVVGDPAQLKITELCETLGWKSPSGRNGAFDVLPLLVNVAGEDPKVFNIPKELALQIDLAHPQYEWFEELGLKWYAVHSVSNMAVEIGGLNYTAAPFGGIQLSAQVATRGLCDPYRYNILEEVAFQMGLDTSSIVNLWKDEALVEINIAVLTSFQSKKVSILDHHSASEKFISYFLKEFKVRGGCPANWTAIVPPISGSLTQVYHQEMLLYKIQPCFENQEEAWKSHVWVNESLKKVNLNKKSMKSAASAISLATFYMNKVMARRVKATILFASETGKSEMFSKRLGQLFQKAFNCEIVAMDNYDLARLPHEKLILIVASTFGSGDAPQNGKIFSQVLSKVENMDSDKRPKFSVLGLGSSAYPDFCAFGKFCDQTLQNLGCKQLLPIATADEIKSQEKSFKCWANQIFQICCDEFDIIYNSNEESSISDDEDKLFDSMKIARSQTRKSQQIFKGLSEVHRKNVVPCKIISRTQLQSPLSDRQTILVKLDTSESGLKYEPGDHLGIFPTNQPELVKAVCRRLAGIDPTSLTSDIVSIRVLDKENFKDRRVNQWKEGGRLPPCTVWTALSNYLDITTPPIQSFLKKLADLASNEKEKATLLELAQNDEAYEKWKFETYPTLVDVLEQFSSVALDLRLLLAQLPLMQPRYYSISSSQLYSPNQVHLTVAVVKYHLNGKTRLGVCSNFLNDFPSEPIPCFVVSVDNFRLPNDVERPVIMVGPGTGVAPFRSFWQQRCYEVEKQQSEQNLGKMTLYFGCQKPGVDDIYSKEWQNMNGNRYQFQGKIAFSRANNKPKKYVQHYLIEDANEIFNLLSVQKAHFYVCGEVSMAADVRNSLKNIFQTQGNMTTDEAGKFLSKLKEDGRFQEDIFGAMVKSY